MKEIPVNIISGFLGSGKTTAIIQLLDQKQPHECWAIVVNEFGKVPIDGQTLRSASTSGSVFDISGGCICCSAKGYLRDNLVKIIENGSFDRIVIEPSGLGGIEIVVEIVEMTPGLKTMPVICMVDLKAIGNQRLQINLIYRAQIAKAELIVFSKLDLLPETKSQDASIKKFKVLFPEKTRYLPVALLTPSLLNKDLPEAQGIGPPFYFFENPNLTDRNYLEKHLQFGKRPIFDPEKLSAFFNKHPEILRAKGHILSQQGWLLFNFTLSGCTFEPCQDKDRTDLVLIAETGTGKLFPDFGQEIKSTCLHKTFTDR